MASINPQPKGSASAWLLFLVAMSSTLQLSSPQTFRPTCFSSIDLLIIIDSSGSVPFLSPYNWQTAKNLTKNYIDTLDISSNMVRVALIQVADNADVVFNLLRYNTAQEMKREIDRLQVTNDGKTNLAEAFEFARTMIFTPENGDRQNVQNALLFISDGVPTLRITDTLPEAERLKREKNVNIISFGMSGAIVNKTLLQQISSLNRQEVISFDQFDLTKHILMDQKVDLCLIVDASGSINFLNPNNWFYAKQFLKSLIRQLEVRIDGIRVACVTFNETAELQFDLGRFNDDTSLFEAFDRLPYYGGKTNLAAALRMARTKVFGRNGNFRTDRRPVVVVITDGIPTEEKNETQIEADNLKREGVHLVSVVVKGDAQVDISMLNSIASYSPVGTDVSRRAVVQVTDYRSLSISTTSVLQRICMVEGQAPPPTADPNELVCYSSCNPTQRPEGLPRGRYQFCSNGFVAIPSDCTQYLICDGPGVSNGNNNGFNNGRNLKTCGSGLQFDYVLQTCRWWSCTCPGRKRRCEIGTDP